MKKAILGTKVGMTQMFREDGTMIPVTVVLAGPCPVVQKKTVEHDGYDAIQVAFKPVREKLVTKPEMGHLKKAGVGAHRYVREFKLDDTASYEVGQVISANVFADGDKVDVVGTSKGKRVCRQHQALEPGPRPQDPRLPFLPALRAPWAPAPTRAKVFKTKHLPGHMGHERVTVQNLEVVRVGRRAQPAPH